MHDFSNAGRLGARILYMLSEYDVKAIISERRQSGYSTHHGNDPREGTIYPGVVVADWGGAANLQVWLDGNDTYWPTSRGKFDPSHDGHYLYFYTDTNGDEHNITFEAWKIMNDRPDLDTRIKLRTEIEPDARGHWVFAE